MLFLVLNTPAFAANYYVNDTSTTGDVSFPGCPTMGLGQPSAPCGTCNQPCATAQLAYDNNPLGPGDTLYLNTGRYVATAAGAMIDLTNPAKAGAPGAPLAIIGLVDPAGYARRDGSGIPLVLLDGNDTANFGVRIQVSNVTVSGMGIVNISCAGGYGPRVFVDSTVGPVNGFVISGIEGYGPGCVLGSSIQVTNLQPDCVGCEIRFNRIHSSSFESAGIFLEGTAGAWIHHNEVWGINTGYTSDRFSVQLNAASQTRFENNTIRNNGSTGLRVGPCENAALCGSATSTEVVIVNNTFARNIATTDSIFAAEVFLAGENLIFENNIIIANKQHGLRVRFGTTFSRIDYNGYFREGTAQAVVDENIAADYASLADWQAAGKEPNSIEANPLFVSDSLLRLQSMAGHVEPDGTRVADGSNSPFLDRGNPATSFALEERPNGGRVNLGAEGNSPQASYTPVTLSLVSGDRQRGTPGLALDAPLVVQVHTADGTAVPGIEVQFTAVSGGGSVANASVVTNDSGDASTQATLGGLGVSTYNAQLASIQNAGTVTFVAGDGSVSLLAFTVACGCQAAGSAQLTVLALLSLGLFLRPRR